MDRVHGNLHQGFPVESPSSLVSQSSDCLARDLQMAGSEISAQLTESTGVISYQQRQHPSVSHHPRFIPTELPADSESVRDGNGPGYHGSAPVWDGSGSSHAASARAWDGSGPSQAGSVRAWDGSGPSHAVSVPAWDGGPSHAGSVRAWDGSGPRHVGSVRAWDGSGPRHVGSVRAWDGSGPSHAGSVPAWDGSGPSHAVSVRAWDGSGPSHVGLTPVGDDSRPRYPVSVHAGDSSGPSNAGSAHGGESASVCDQTPALMKINSLVQTKRFIRTKGMKELPASGQVHDPQNQQRLTQQYDEQDFRAWVKLFEHKKPLTKKYYEINGKQVSGSTLFPNYHHWVNLPDRSEDAFVAYKNRPIVSAKRHYVKEDYHAWVEQFKLGMPKARKKYLLNGVEVPGRTLHKAYQQWKESPDHSAEAFAASKMRRSSRAKLPGQGYTVEDYHAWIDLFKKETPKTQMNYILNDKVVPGCTLNYNYQLWKKLADVSDVAFINFKNAEYRSQKYDHNDYMVLAEMFAKEKPHYAAVYNINGKIFRGKGLLNKYQHWLSLPESMRTPEKFSEFLQKSSHVSHAEQFLDSLESFWKLDEESFHESFNEEHLEGSE